MPAKKLLANLVAICLMLCTVLTLGGCDDLGEYEDEDDYYETFGDILLIDSAGEDESYSVEDYFYNESSREDFLVSDDGKYGGVPTAEYLYMAIPVKCDIVMDSLALYVLGDSEQGLYFSVYITDGIPSKIRKPGDPFSETVDKDGETVEEEIKYDDPNPKSSLCDSVYYFDGNEWDAFLVEIFKEDGVSKDSISVKKDQYILIQFRNNSGIRVLDKTSGGLVDEKSGLALDSTGFTMTNLLIRVLQRGD